MKGVTDYCWSRPARRRRPSPRAWRSAALVSHVPLAPWQTQLNTVRVFSDEQPLLTPDNQTIAVPDRLVGDGVTDRSRGSETDRRRGSGRRWLSTCCSGLLWSSTDGPCPWGEVAYHPGGRESGSQTIDAVAMGYR